VKAVLVGVAGVRDEENEDGLTVWGDGIDIVPPLRLRGNVAPDGVGLGLVEPNGVGLELVEPDGVGLGLLGVDGPRA